MITKELLNEIIMTVKTINEVEHLGRDIFWKGITHGGVKCNGTINIHELVHKCKEWVFEPKGWQLTSFRRWEPYPSCTQEYGAQLLTFNGEVCDECQESFSEQFFTAPTEPEAVFKACQWLLEHKDTYVT